MAALPVEALARMLAQQRHGTLAAMRPASGTRTVRGQKAQIQLLRKKLADAEAEIDRLRLQMASMRPPSRVTRLRHRMTRIRHRVTRLRHRVTGLRYRVTHERARVAHPRIGVLWQAAPEPLRVPARYQRSRPPARAPTVSIVTPTFRGERYLERTMLSVLDQAYPALEYVVQDGGSGEAVTSILERYDDRLASWQSRPDRGQTHALNLGFAQTSGELMAYVNDDDLLLPGSLAYATQYLVAHPQIDLVYGQRVLIDHNGHRVGLWITPPHDDEMLRYVDYVPQETMVWRRSIWDRAGGEFDESFQFAMDWDLLLRFREAGAHFARLPRLLGAFRVLPNQKTQAMADVGERDCMRLRELHNGVPHTNREAVRQIAPYIQRSVAHHVAFRARERLEPRWLAVEAGPI
jgi:hypothetical protein